MFGLPQLAPSARRIGLGIAVAALAITSLVIPVASPAHAAGQESAPPTKNGPTILKADLQVTARGKTVKDGKTYYHFQVKNNGPAPATQIVAYKEAQVKALIGNGFNLQDNGYFNMSLGVGQSQAVTVTCTPPSGYYCSQGTVLVFMNTMTDPDHSNDIATIH